MRWYELHFHYDNGYTANSTSVQVAARSFADAESIANEFLTSNWHLTGITVLDKVSLEVGG